MVIVCGSLPGANGSVVARLEKFFLHRPSRKILIPLHDGASVALCNDLAGPDRLWHNTFPQSSLLLSGSVQQMAGTLRASSAFERRNIHGRTEFLESHQIFPALSLFRCADSAHHFLLVHLPVEAF